MNNEIYNDDIYSDEIYSRLKSLVEGVGVRIEDTNTNGAELYCYSLAIAMVRRQIKAVCDEFFANSQTGVKRYAKLLKIDCQNKSQQQLVEEIRSRLSDDYGNLRVEQMAQDYSLVGSGSYEMRRKKLVFSDVAVDDMARLAQFITKWSTMATQCVFDGDGTTFDRWDDMEQSFDYYDRLGLPFDIFDTYNYNKESEASE